MTLSNEFHVFGEDYGTSEYKFGLATLGNIPDSTENRGYFPDMRGALANLSQAGKGKKLLVVGPDVGSYVEAKRDIAERMVYPMRNGVIEKEDERAWQVVKEITRYGLKRYVPAGDGFQGFKCVAALAASAPRYMYERLFRIHEEINQEEGKTSVSALSIIPQPLAVAIAQKKLACTVLEGGHGNTQVAPISSGVIFSALISLNRGGSDGDQIAAEILKDAGYADLAREPKLVRLFKEAMGCVPRDLDSVISNKSNPDFSGVFKIPNTRISIDLGENSWQRFLIGEYFFNPGLDIFRSYYSRGFPRPEDTSAGNRVILGTTDLADVVIESVQRCSFEIQPSLYRNVLLSGGAFAWKVPERLGSVAVDAPTKLSLMLDSKGVSGVHVELTKNPAYNVWQGCVTYGMYIPDDYAWDWQSREGWMKIDGPK
jgi:crenactin